MKKRLLPLLLVFSIIMSLMPISEVEAAGVPALPDKAPVYIGSAEDLLAIDGQDGGYYVLSKDISLEGISWKPLMLTNAYIDGNGHSITGLTFTGECIDYYFLGLIGEMYNEDKWQLYSNDYGLYATGGNVVCNLGLEDTDISATVAEEYYFEGNINPLGLARAYNCSFSGEISLSGYNDAFLCGGYQATGCESTVSLVSVDDYAKRCGLLRCKDSTYTGDFDDFGFSYYVYGIYESTDCRLYGNVCCGDFVYGIYGSEGCSFYGDITGGHIRGICGGSDCIYKGDIDAYYNAYGMENADSCLFNGDVYASNEAVGILSGKNCRISGNVISEWDAAVGIENGEYSYMTGNVRGYIYSTGLSYGSFNLFRGAVTNIAEAYYDRAYAAGISDESNSVFYGDVYAEFNEAYGIYNANRCNVYRSTGCTLYGNIKGDYAIGIYSINDDEIVDCNMRLYGDVYGQCAIGISGYYGDSYMYGNVYARVKNDDVSAASDAAGIIGSGGAYPENCVLTGAVSAENGSVRGIYHSRNCTINGNIKATGGSATGIENSEASRINGSVRAVNGSAYSGNCGRFISGGISGSFAGKTISKTKPDTGDEYSSILKFSPCNHVLLSEGYADQYTGRFICDTCKQYRKARGITVKYSAYTAGEYTEPVYSDSTYYLKAIDRVSGEPLAGAVFTLDGKSYTADYNGLVEVTGSAAVLSLTISHNGAAVYEDSGYMAVPGGVNIIEVGDLKLEPEDIFTGGYDTDTLLGPEVSLNGTSFNLFEFPVGFEAKLFDCIKIAYDENRDVYQIVGKTSSEAPDNEKISNASSPTWKEMYGSIKELYNQAKGGSISKSTFERFKSTCSPVPKQLVFESDLYATLYMELRPEGKSFALNEAGAIIIGEAGYNGYMPFPAAPYVFLAYGISGELSGTGGIKIVKEASSDPGFELTSAFSGAAVPKIGIGAGINGAVSAEAGISGRLEANLDIPITTLSQALTIDLYADIYVLIEALGFESKVTGHFAGAQLYPEQYAQLSLMNDTADMSLVQRGEPAPALMSSDSLDESIYPYSSVETGCLSDGSIIAVWTDDAPARRLINKTTLYYCLISPDGTFGEVKQIHSDGTADYRFDLDVYDGRAAIVWQNASRVFDDNENIDTVALNTDIYFAEFEGSAWGEPVRITSDGYEYSPALTVGYDKSRIMWVCNDNDSPIPGINTSRENVYCTTVSGGMAGETTLVCENIPFVRGIASDNNNNTAVIAGDVLYINGEAVYDNDAQLTALHHVNGEFFFTEDGSLMSFYGGNVTTVFASETDTKNITVCNDRRTLIFDIDNGFGTVLWASEYDESSSGWKTPLPLSATDGSEKIRSRCILSDYSGNVKLAAVDADITAEGGSLTNAARLIYTDARAKEDLAVKSLYTDSDVIPGKDIKLKIETNSTLSTCSYFNITVNGEKCGVLTQQTVSAQYGEGVQTVNVTLPGDFEKQTLAAVIEGVDYNSNVIREADTVNNSASAVFGTADLSVELDGYQVTDSGTVKLTVANNSAETAENCIVTLNADGEEIYIKNIAAVNAGEKLELEISVDKKYYDFQSTEDSLLLTGAVLSDAAEEYIVNNEAAFKVEADRPLLIAAKRMVFSLEPGMSCTPQISFLPLGSYETELIFSSDNTDIATVSADGIITAVDEGTAVIRCASPEIQTPAYITVYVYERGAPVISSLTYQDNSSEYDISGYISISADLTDCLMSGEKALLIAAAYDESGCLAGIESKEITGSDYITVYTSKYVPEYVKIMLWEPDSMRPLSKAAYTTAAS